MKVDGGGVGRLRFVAPCMLALAVAFAGAAAIGAATTTSAVAAGAGREKLAGHQGLVPPGATLVGPAPTTTTLPLTVTLKPRDPAALAVEAQQVSDPTSAEYRHFLTTKEFAREFGPAPSTIAQVTSSLRQEGLTVGTPSATGLSLPVSGTVAQVQSAFSTPISKYRLSSGKIGYDNAAAPEVDTTVAPQVEGILGLDTLSPPQPSTSVPEASTAAAQPTTDLASLTLAPGQPQPATGSCATGINNETQSTGALDAPDLAQAYSFDPLYSSNDYGAGSTIALVEMSGAGYSSSDVNHFATCYGITLANGQVKQVTVGGGGATGGGTAEAELDIETALAMAPKADIEVYEGGISDSLYTVFSQIVNDDTAKIVSASWTNGCEAYVGQSTQNSENTLFQAAAAEGQSIFVASGDQGAQGCNINAKVSASTGSDPVAQAVDQSTGTLYVANKSSNTVSVDSEGSTSNPSNFSTAGSVSTGTGSGPDAAVLDPALGKVFVADHATSSLTVIATGTCNQTTTSGCSSPTQIASGGHLNSPTALVVNGSGSTLYVANGNGTVAVYSVGATTTTYVATVALASGSVPTALALDATNGYVYVADGTNNRIEFFSATTCNAATTSGCSSPPATVAVGNDPVALAVAGGAGDLYVANAGSGGGISVVSLSTHAVVNTIPTSQTSNGTGVVQSIGVSPDGNEVLAILNGLSFPGDVMATIDTSTESVTSTVSLETGTDAMGQLVSDGTRDYVWVVDETNGGDVIQNLNLAVSDPASQPYVTSVGGTSLGHGAAQALGPPPAEQVWNDSLYYSEGAGGGGISETFAMPAYQRGLGVVSGSSGTPCASAGGDCREVPDVSADADPSSGYIVYDTVDGETGWTALGGTSGATPLWAAVLAVAASGDGNAAGYGALNPALYALAQKAPGAYLNDVTSGNNDYNATAAGQYPAMTGYDMATGLGTPVASELASGLTAIPLDVVVSGSQTYGSQSPTFTASPDYAGPGTTPFGVTINTSGASCTQVEGSTAIGPTLPAGSDTLLPSSCSGATLSGTNAADYVIVYTSAPGDFTINPAPLTITASTGSMGYGGTPPTVTPTYSGFVNNETPSSLTTQPTCSTTATSASPVSGNPYSTSCAGAVDPDYSFSYVGGSVTVTPVMLTITASSPTMASGGSVPTIVPTYSGFVNGDTPSSLSTQASCTTTVTSSSPASPPTYPSTCSGASDSNYSFNYVPGAVTVTDNPVYVAVSGTQTYGGDPTFSGTDTPPSGTSIDTTGLICSDVTPVTAIAPTLPAGAASVLAPSCSGAILSGPDAADYAIVYTSVQNDFTVAPAALSVTASNGTMSYGANAPTITPSYSGFENGDDASSLGGQFMCSTVATSASAVAGSPYPSSCSGAVDANYVITYVPGVVTVTPASLTVVAASGTMAYGSSPPTITPSYTGFVNGDSRSSLTTPPTCTTSATSTSSPSPPTYLSWCSGATDPNYTIGYLPGAVTVSEPQPAQTPSPPAPTPAAPPSYGYWLVGSDGGIFTFGSAQFYGSTGSIRLQRPVVGISPTANKAGYWLVASDGGIFAFGNAGYYGSIPGVGLSPAGSGQPHSLNAPIVAMVPSSDGGGYFMVASDGGVFAFGDARFAGSCPGIGGCSGTAVAVVPDASGNGYWLITQAGNVYAFGDAPFYGAPGNQGSPVTSAVRTADGGGYWVLLANGAVYAYGDAASRGGPVGAVGGIDPASAIFSDADGGGYWVASAAGAVFAYGDAPNDGSMAGNHLNGSIIAATGF